MLDIWLILMSIRIMNNNNRFINEVFRIVNGALRLDIEKVRNYTSFLADKMEEDGDKVTAHRLRKMLEETDHQLHPSNVTFARSLPVDAESRFPLIELVNLKEVEEPPVILTEGQWIIVHEFLSVAKSYALLEAEGVHGSVSLLMYGPPGTGKSRLARYIAQELSLDLYVGRLDGLISSFLGSTSKNIRALFDFAARTPCILFLDDLHTDPQFVLSHCFRFLGVNPTLGEFQNLPHLPKNTRSGKRTDRAILRRMKRSRFFAGIHEAMPRWATEYLKPIFRRRIKATIDWEPGLRRQPYV